MTSPKILRCPKNGGDNACTQDSNPRFSTDLQHYTGPRGRHYRLEQYRHGCDEGGQRRRQSMDAQHGPGERVDVRRGQLGPEPIFALRDRASHRSERLG